MKVTGKLLKEKRESRGISLNEVQLATKIGLRTLLSIEEGDLSKLPPKTFVRGFVKSYAQFLQMDVDQVLASFHEEVGPTRSVASATPPSSISAELPTSEKSRSLSDSSEAEDAIHPKEPWLQRVGVFGSIVLLIFLIVVVRNKMRSYEIERAVQVRSVEKPTVPVPAEARPQGPPAPADAAAVADDGDLPPAPVEASAAVAANEPSDQRSGSSLSAPIPASTAIPTVKPSLEVAPKSSPEATPKPSPAAATPKPTTAPVLKPSTTATPKPTPEPTPIPAPVPTPKPTPVPTPKPAPTPDSKSAMALAAAPSASPTPSPTPKPKTGNIDVMIEALDAVEIEIVRPNGEKKKVSLQGDQVHTMRVERGVSLNISNGGAVVLSVGGKDRGTPGDLGKPAKVTLP